MTSVARRLEQEPLSDLCTLLTAACEEGKAKDIVLLDTSSLSDMFRYQIIATGNSDRQVQGICNRICESLQERGLEPYAIEGRELGHWVALDCGEIVVHIFYGPTREHYDLESLWVKAPRVTLGRAKTELQLV